MEPSDSSKSLEKTTGAEHLDSYEAGRVVLKHHLVHNQYIVNLHGAGEIPPGNSIGGSQDIRYIVFTDYADIHIEYTKMKRSGKNSGGEEIPLVNIHIQSLFVRLKDDDYLKMWDVVRDLYRHRWYLVVEEKGVYIRGVERTGIAREVTATTRDCTTNPTRFVPLVPRTVLHPALRSTLSFRSPGAADEHLRSMFPTR
jgi:hypothetical protein